MARAQDDGVRGARGLCISIRPQGEKLELTLDMVTGGRQSIGTWKHDVFITFADIDIAQAKRFDFSEEQLANFGRLTLGALLGGAV